MSSTYRVTWIDNCAVYGIETHEVTTKRAEAALRVFAAMSDDEGNGTVRVFVGRELVACSQDKIAGVARLLDAVEADHTIRL
jgi:hypothetical protein